MSDTITVAEAQTAALVAAGEHRATLAELKAATVAHEAGESEFAADPSDKNEAALVAAEQALQVARRREKARRTRLNEAQSALDAAHRDANRKEHSELYRHSTPEALGQRLGPVRDDIINLQRQIRAKVGEAEAILSEHAVDVERLRELSESVGIEHRSGPFKVESVSLADFRVNVGLALAESDVSDVSWFCQAIRFPAFSAGFVREDRVLAERLHADFAARLGGCSYRWSQ